MARKKTETPARRGRPPSELTERIMLRATTEELEHWRKIAIAAGINLSTWLRIAARACAHRDQHRRAS